MSKGVKKLKDEVDRTLQKADELLDGFNRRWAEQAHCSPVSRDRVDAALKNHLQKLQKIRTQIRVWL